MKKQLINLIIVAMSMATAWAIRGQFGHEPGAAWAGAIGALALVLVARRKDWNEKIVPIAFSSALGWGAGGMISYGIVVGYGRGTEFFNTSYGFLMLVVIGGLYGLLGGGLVGLTLDSSKRKPVQWPALMAEMVAGGVIGYYLIIEQLELLMTPPRSEAWAACLGAGLAMIWYMIRHDHKAPLRVALFSALGAGFGFSFGNFLQTLFDTLQIPFNNWNVMEYNIGFWGGLAMAYSVFRSEWDEESAPPSKGEHWIVYLLGFVFIPLIVFKDSGLMKAILDPMSVGTTANPNGSNPGSWMMAFLTLGVMGWTGKFIVDRQELPNRRSVWQLWAAWLGLYMILSFGVTGAFQGVFPSNHILYVVNFVVLIGLLSIQESPFSEPRLAPFAKVKAIRLAVVALLVLLLLAYVATQIHGEMGGAHNRF